MSHDPPNRVGALFTLMLSGRKYIRPVKSKLLKIQDGGRPLIIILNFEKRHFSASIQTIVTKFDA